MEKLCLRSIFFGHRDLIAEHTPAPADDSGAGEYVPNRQSGQYDAFAGSALHEKSLVGVYRDVFTDGGLSAGKSADCLSGADRRYRQCHLCPAWLQSLAKQVCMVGGVD